LAVLEIKPRALLGKILPLTVLGFFFETRGPHLVTQAGLELEILPASASQLLGLQTSTTILGFYVCFIDEETKAKLNKVAFLQVMSQTSLGPGPSKGNLGDFFTD
jgi:hypothetical protein